MCRQISDAECNYCLSLTYVLYHYHYVSLKGVNENQVATEDLPNFLLNFT
jgi:hypothetical protein